MDAQPDLRILCVEDDPHLREAIVYLLEDEGYTVTAVSTAEDGLEQLRTSRFHLVLTDYALPGAPGTWMLAEASAAGLLHDTAALVLTANIDPPRTSGVKVLRKPIDVEELLGEVASALVSARQAAIRELALAAAARAVPEPPVNDAPRLVLRLYVSSRSPATTRVLRNLHRLLGGYRPQQIGLSVIDLARELPDVALTDRVAFTPTLIRCHPAPVLRILGSLDRLGVVEDWLEDAGVERSKDHPAP